MTQLFVKIIPLRAGTAEPAGEAQIVACPSDVEPDTILSFLTQRMGEVIETTWTSTERHERIATGWVVAGPAAAGPQDAVEFACIPLLETAGRLRPLFEAQADQRQEFGRLATRHGLDYEIVQRPQRAYLPSDGQNTSTPQPQQPQSRDLDKETAEIARQAGATLHVYPRPGPAVRRIVLQDDRDDRGSRYQDAAVHEDGTLTITGRDQGPGVSEFFGSGITRYEWAYTVAPERVPDLIRILAGHDGHDILELLAAYYQREQGQISDLMKRPDVRADFSNWHS